MAEPVLTPQQREGFRIIFGLVAVIAIVGAVVVAAAEGLNLKDTGEETRAKECRAHGGTLEGVRCTVRYGPKTYDLPMHDNRFDEEQAGWRKEDCDRKNAEGQGYRWHPKTGVCEFVP